MTELLNFLRNKECFIEAEGKTSSLNNFIEDYNNRYGESLSIYDDGIIHLKPNANKWGLELRLYVRTRPPENVYELGFTHNNAYRDDFMYRLNDNHIVKLLLENGYRIGFNLR